MIPARRNGQKRPDDLICNVVRVMLIATGEEEDTVETPQKNSAAQKLGRKGGKWMIWLL